MPGGVKRVLVTGATGPFGRAVSRRLAEAGYEVVAMARRAPTSPMSGVEFIAGDIQDAGAVATAMRGCDAVVHLAWVVAPLKSKSATAAINLGGTQNVLDAMASTGCSRLVFSSSVLAYGAVPGHPPLLKEGDERRPEPEHLYAAHKKAAEDMITATAPNAVIVRAGIIAGRTVDNTIFRFFCSPALPVPNPGRAQQFVHTDDVARFTVDAVSGTGSGPVNITGDGAVTMREIASIIERPLVTVSERALRRAISAAWKLRLSELAPAEVGALLYMPIVDTTRLREEWGFTCAWSSRAALIDMARAVHGRVTLGKKTLHLPWRVATGADPDIGKLSALLLRRTYAEEVERTVLDLAGVLADGANLGDEFQRTAHAQLVADIADHAALLAIIGEHQGYPSNVVAKAASAAQEGTEICGK